MEAQIAISPAQEAAIRAWATDLVKLIEKPPHAEKIASINQVRKFKASHKSWIRRLTKRSAKSKLTEQILGSIHLEISAWYSMDEIKPIFCVGAK